MKSYSECPTCSELLLIADPDLPVHPSCDIPYRLQLEIQLREAARSGDLDTFDELAKIVDAPRKTSLPRSAALYAEWGWGVFPLRAGQKIPATKHGFKDATTDADTIAAWWNDNPHYNIGLATGAYFDVLDVDTKTRPTGYQSLVRLDDAAVVPDTHGRVLTTSGGLHLYVLSGGLKNGAGILPGIDVRAAGGYVVAPPSIVDGKPYMWLDVPSPALKKATASKHKWLGAA